MVILLEILNATQPNLIPRRDVSEEESWDNREKPLTKPERAPKGVNNSYERIVSSSNATQHAQYSTSAACPAHVSAYMPSVLLPSDNTNDPLTTSPMLPPRRPPATRYHSQSIQSYQSSHEPTVTQNKPKQVTFKEQTYQNYAFDTTRNRDSQTPQTPPGYDPRSYFWQNHPPESIGAPPPQPPEKSPSDFTQTPISTYNILEKLPKLKQAQNADRHKKQSTAGGASAQNNKDNIHLRVGGDNAHGGNSSRGSIDNLQQHATKHDDVPTDKHQQSAKQQYDKHTYSHSPNNVGEADPHSPGTNNANIPLKPLSSVPQTLMIESRSGMFDSKDSGDSGIDRGSGTIDRGSGTSRSTISRSQGSTNHRNNKNNLVRSHENIELQMINTRNDADSTYAMIDDVLPPSKSLSDEGLPRSVSYDASNEEGDEGYPRARKVKSHDAIQEETEFSREELMRGRAGMDAKTRRLLFKQESLKNRLKKFSLFQSKDSTINESPPLPTSENARGAWLEPSQIQTSRNATSDRRYPISPNIVIVEPNELKPKVKDNGSHINGNSNSKWQHTQPRDTTDPHANTTFTSPETFRKDSKISYGSWDIIDTPSDVGVSPSDRSDSISSREALAERCRIMYSSQENNSAQFESFDRLKTDVVNSWNSRLPFSKSPTLNPFSSNSIDRPMRFQRYMSAPPQADYDGRSPRGTYLTTPVLNSPDLQYLVRESVGSDTNLQIIPKRGPAEQGYVPSMYEDTSPVYGGLRHRVPPVLATNSRQHGGIQSQSAIAGKQPYPQKQPDHHQHRTLVSIKVDSPSPPHNGGKNNGAYIVQMSSPADLSDSFHV